MQIGEFCSGIQLADEASRFVIDYQMNESEYIELKQQFKADRQAFFQLITGAERYRQKLLYLFTRFAIDAYEEYQVRSIPDHVYFDTFSDIRIWSEVCYRDYGEYGIEEYNWLQEHVQLRLFRLGRLQFQPIAVEDELKAGDWTVMKHRRKLNSGFSIELQQIHPNMEMKQACDVLLKRTCKREAGLAEAVVFMCQQAAYNRVARLDMR